MISRIKSYFNDDYMKSRSTARFLAKYFAPLFFPVYLYFRLKNYVFLTNTFPGVGHIVPEIDNFLRKKFLSEIPENKKYIFLYKNHSIPFEFSQNYSHFFYKCIVNSKIYALLSPLLIRFPSITLDSGFALIKYHKFKDLTYEESLKQQRNYYLRKNRSPNFFPLKLIDKSKPSFLNIDPKKKLCLLHLRGFIANASAIPCDPNTFISAIRYLFQQDYQVVLIGRDPSSKALLDLGCIDYASSNLASFSNDLLLFNSADIVLVNAAGTGNLADSFNVPHLFLNSWHTNLVTYGISSVYIPTLLRENGEFISIKEQNRLGDALQYQFDLVKLQPRNATEDEILAGVIEVLEIKNNKDSSLTINQKKIKAIDVDKGWVSVSKIRMSKFFLEKHSSEIKELA